MKSKSIFKSKTVWGNLIAGVVIPALVEYGVEISAEETAAILVILNLALRLITKKPVHFIATAG